MSSPRPSSRSGFTLLELLVSISVSVGIVAGAYLCLHGGLVSRKLCEERMDIAQTARAALALLAADLSAACAYGKGDSFIGMRRSLEDLDADNVDFITHNWRPRGPGEADICEVSYFLDRDRETGEWVLRRRRDPSPDDDLLDGGSQETIAEGIAGLRLEYSDGLSWYDNWNFTEYVPRNDLSYELSTCNLGGLPEAVRITLAFRSPGGERKEAPLPRNEYRKEKEERKAPESPSEEPEVRSESEPQGFLYRTVVRLNLAGRVTSSLLGSLEGSTSSSETGAAQTPGGASAPEGGNR